MIIVFDNAAEANTNDTPRSLASYVQTGNPDRASRVAEKLRVGSARINGAGINYGSPFDGYKQFGK